MRRLDLEFQPRRNGPLAWSLLAVLGPGMFSERWVDIAVSGTVLYYLTRPEIKRAFGKA